MALGQYLFALEQALRRTPCGEGACSRWTAKLASSIHRVCPGGSGSGLLGLLRSPAGASSLATGGGGSQEVGFGLNDSTCLRSEPGYASLLEGAPMKSKSLVACLLVAASLSTASVVVQAGDTPQETVQPSNINARDWYKFVLLKTTNGTILEITPVKQ